MELRKELQAQDQSCNLCYEAILVILSKAGFERSWRYCGVILQA